MRETQVRSLGQEDLLEEEMATHSSILAKEIPWTVDHGGLQSAGSQKSWSRLSTHSILLLLLSCFSRVRLRTTPWMAAHQAPMSLGFSRQEHWSGLPFPSPMHESKKWKWSRLVVSDPQRPHGLQPTRLLCPWDFPGKSTGVGYHCLLHALTKMYPKGITFRHEVNCYYLFVQSYVLGQVSLYATDTLIPPSF